MIARPEEPYQLWCVVVCDVETSRLRRPWPALGRSARGGDMYIYIYIYIYIHWFCNLAMYILYFAVLLINIISPNVILYLSWFELCNKVGNSKVLKCDGTCAEKRFRLSARRPSPFKFLVLFQNWGQLKCDGTRAEPTFRLSAKRTSPFKSAGASVQSTTGSRGVSISGSNAGYTMFRGSVKGTGYPLHSPVSTSVPLLASSHFNWSPHIFSPVCSWTWEGFKVLLISPVIWRNFDILTVTSLSFWYEKEQPGYFHVFIRSVILLFIRILLFMDLFL